MMYQGRLRRLFDRVFREGVGNPLGYQTGKSLHNNVIVRYRVRNSAYSGGCIRRTSSRSDDVNWWFRVLALETKAEQQPPVVEY